MTHRPDRRAAIATLACGAAWPWTLSQAQASAWPTRPVRVVVPYPAGGSPDILVRLAAEQMSTILGQPFTVENRAGASGLIAARAVSQTPGDTHLLAYLSSGHVTLQAMNPSFNILKEFKPVARYSSSPFVCIVNAQSPYKTMQDLVQAAYANPGKLSFGSAGVGSPAHMAVEYLENKLPRFKGLHVPFKGAVESVNAILGSQIDFSIALLGTSIGQIQGGKLRALAVTTPKPLSQLPDVPTIGDTVAPGYVFDAWGGFAFPAGVPDEVVTRLYQALSRSLTAAPLLAHSAKTGSVLNLSSSPREFAEQIQNDAVAEVAIVKRLGLI